MIKKNPNEVYALGQHIHMSAHKARRVIDQIRGLLKVILSELFQLHGFLPYQEDEK